ncbi:MAG: putative DNA binding domain-containing protein [Sphingopyxis sp.]|nr:putative DNA binding domain-containing protein [Sphingopyxis sp.]
MEQIGFDFEYLPKRTARHMSVDELYDDMSIHIAIDVEESQKIERKSAKIAARDLGVYFSMWANTPPFGGVIIVGVENDGKLSGCNSVSDEHLSDLHRAGDVFCPEARYTSKDVTFVNSKGVEDTLVVFRVLYREDRVVETVSHDAYARRGSSKRLLSDAEKRELAISKGQLEIEREPVTLKYPDDFRIPLINQFVENVRRDRDMALTHTPEEILELRRLGRIRAKGFEPNLACALLFAKDPQLVVPGCKIRFLRFDGTTEKTGKEHNAVKSSWIEGPVPELIVEAEKIVSAQLREFMRLGPDGKFISTAEYPKDAWYEAIVNACVHRSYNLSTMHIVVKMFDDRLEVESPGGFPPLVTPQNIYDVHVPRNPHLMDAMFYLKFVLCEHEGTRRIRDSMAGLGLPAPVFTEITATAAYVRVTLRNDVEHREQFVDSDAFMVLGEALSSTLTAPERRIVNYIAEHGTINATEAARLTGVRWHTVKKALLSLVERNILDHVHSATIERDRHAYFILKKRFVDRLRGK